jgi:two-component system, OmpR family, alkaline phosphatase synthesis response regulator PhoP
VTENSRRILIVEDDHDLTELITTHLHQEGFDAIATHDGESGLKTYNGSKWDLVILDWMMPGMSGLDVLREIREKDSHTPVLMLTARGEEADKVLGLELGCDDYMTKPFSLRELVARINVLCRRVELALELASEDSAHQILKFKSMVIDSEKRRVTVDGNQLQLTLKEYDLLYTMAKHPGRTYSRSQLLNLVWDQDSDVYEHTVNSHVNRLRSKVEKNPNSPEYILTVWGLGYRFTDEV